MAAAREVSPGALTSRPIVVDYGCFLELGLQFRSVIQNSINSIPNYKSF